MTVNAVYLEDGDAKCVWFTAGEFVFNEHLFPINSLCIDDEHEDGNMTRKGLERLGSRQIPYLTNENMITKSHSEKSGTNNG